MHNPSLESIADAAYLEATMIFEALDSDIFETVDYLSAEDRLRQRSIASTAYHLGIVAAANSELDLARHFQNHQSLADDTYGQIKIALARAERGDDRTFEEVSSLLTTEAEDETFGNSIFSMRAVLNTLIQESAEKNLPVTFWVERHEADPSKKIGHYIDALRYYSDEMLAKEITDQIFARLQDKQLDPNVACNHYVSLLAEDKITLFTRQRAFDELIALRTSGTQYKADVNDTAIDRLANLYFDLETDLRSESTDAWLASEISRILESNYTRDESTKITLGIASGALNGMSAEELIAYTRSAQAVIVSNRSDDSLFDDYQPIDTYFALIARTMAAKGDFLGARTALTAIAADDTEYLSKQVVSMQDLFGVEDELLADGDDSETAESVPLVEDAYINTYRSFSEIIDYAQTIDQLSELDMPEFMYLHPLFGLRMSMARYKFTRHSSDLETAVQCLASIEVDLPYISMSRDEIIQDTAEYDTVAARKLHETLMAKLRITGAASPDLLSVLSRSALKGNTDALRELYERTLSIDDLLLRCRKLAHIAYIGCKKST